MTALLPWESGDRVRIGRLRVHGDRHNTSLRLALSSMLDRTDLRPTGVPPAAMLIVRHMSDPWPGQVAPRHIAGSIDARWQKAVRDRLAGFYRRASRPGRETVPAEAEAVVFADEGELLASLALDLVRGRLRERWWWRSLGSSLPSQVAVLLRDRAAWVPAALAFLARQDRAVEVVRALSQQQALMVLTAVSQVHEVPAVATGMNAPRPMMPPGPSLKPVSAGDSDRSDPPRTDDDQRSTARRPPAGERAEAPAGHASGPVPPWSKWLRDRGVPAEFDPTQACLLGVALVLHHRHEVVRSAAFADAVRQWWHYQQANPVSLTPTPRSAAPSKPGRTDPTNGPVRAVTKTITGEATPSEPSVALSERHLAPARSLPRDALVPPVDQQPRRRLVDNPQIPRHMAPLASSTSILAAGDGPAQPKQGSRQSADGSAQTQEATAPSHFELPATTADAVIPAPTALASEIDNPSPARPADTTAETPDSNLLLEDGVDTALGGVLFLINAMCALDLPDCFEAEWRLASTVGAWGILEALARALLAPDALYAGDPIWAALTALSGRNTHERLGAGLSRRPRYRLPHAWAAQMPEDANEPTSWAVRGGRLRLWSHAGYVLSETRTETLSDAEQTPYGKPVRKRFADAPLADVSGPLTAGIDHSLKHWLVLAVPFIRLRLIRALGLDPVQESLQTMLLARPGRLYATGTHIDLVMHLRTVSLPVRLAGLDRNPGWLADFGRVILFHFE
jgi:hypothetical protein